VSTAAQIIARVRDRLPATSVNFWSDDDLLLAYNEALDEVSDQTEFVERYCTLPRRAGATYHDLAGILPEDALRVTSVQDLSNMLWLDPATPEELDQKIGRAWDVMTGDARCWFMRGLRVIGIYKTASNSSHPVRIYYSALAPHIATDQTVSPGLPADLEAALEEHILTELWVQARESKLALQHWSAYQEAAKALSEQMLGRVSRDYSPVMGQRRTMPGIRGGYGR
jgi:hypothetical protein